jgi:sugar phosphate isomerase/epimerase
MVEPFAALCARAKTSGAAIAIEPTPLTNLYSIEDCIRLIRHSGAANAGLDIDIWHMARANIAYEHLAAIPVSLIMAVELSDADREVRGTLYQDTMNWRRLCGDGQLDPAGFVAAIHRTGYAGPFSVEIISEEHRARTVTSAARLSIESARRLF